MVSVAVEGADGRTQRASPERKNETKAMTMWSVCSLGDMNNARYSSSAALWKGERAAAARLQLNMCWLTWKL